MPAIASPPERTSAADSVGAVKDYIAANWAAVTHGPDENVLPVGTRALPSEGKIALPERYIVPTAAYQPFRLFFYWDTYFACEGLLRSGQTALAGLEDGLIAAVAAFGADEALRTGQVVDLAPLWRRISAGDAG